MSNKFIEKGSFSDTLNFLKSDLLDTYNNQSNVLSKLFDCENEDTNDFTGKFCLNDNQYWMSYDKNNRKLNIFDAKSSQSSSPEHVIDLENEDLSTGLWSSIDALEADIQDAMDSTYLMYNAACCAENDNGEGIITRMSANCQSWISNAGTNAKSCFQSMCDAANNGGDNSTSIVSWILSQYQSIAGATAENDGSYTFTDDNYHVQGFTGQYALQVAFQAASAVLGVVVSIIAPVIGLTISMAGQALGAIIGLIPDKSDTYIVENAKSLNNIYAQPILQGEYNLSDVPYYARIHCEESNTKSVTLRYPGLVIYQCIMNGKFYVEVFAALDYANYSSPSKYSKGTSLSASEKYKESSPYTQEILQDYMLADSWRFTTPSAVNLKKCMASFNSIARDTSNSAYAEWLNYYGKAYNNDPVSPESCRQYFDKACRASLLMSLFFIFASISVYKYGAGTTWDQSGTVQPVDWANINCLEAMRISWLWKTANDSWEYIVNNDIPKIREAFKNSSDILDLCRFFNTYMEDGDSSEYWLATDGIPSSRIPRFTPPKYSESARSNTIALAIMVGVVVVATIVAKTTLKISQRRKQVERYADVQEKWNNYLADRSDENLKAYRKSIKRYNRWCWIAGTSKLSSISGWEVGSSSEGSITLPSAYKDSSINYNQQNRNSDDELSAIMNQIKYLIRGA